MTKVATFGRHRNINFGPKIALERNLARGCQYLPSQKPVDRMTATALRFVLKSVNISKNYIPETASVMRQFSASWHFFQNKRNSKV